MASVHAMLMGKELNSDGVIIEGDAQQIASAVNSMNPCTSTYGHFIDDIQAGIRSTERIILEINVYCDFLNKNLKFSFQKKILRFV
jgi:hypothetical protein